MNRLGEEQSLYLRQHQGNPVDWYPWGEAAFAEARSRDRPVLLSVGYSTCHWCHVMAHESFEDPQVAELQNRLFVSVKVDREERPDVDRVYMEALMAMTGSGGWPMTVFLLPDGRPYFAGTYFPPEDRQGLPAFRRVLLAAEAAYRERRPELEAVAERLGAALSSSTARGTPGPGFDPRLLVPARDRILGLWDQEQGGLTGAPKFPQAPLLEFLLTRGALAADQAAAEAVRLTLSRMAAGGIRDQLAGGFHRYAVDDRWEVPHFEKMLYDQSQLIRAYLHLGQLVREPGAISVALSTAEALLRDLGLENGGFAAGLDADAGSEEGSTYLWSEEELDRVGSGLLPWRQIFRLAGAGAPVLQAETAWGVEPEEAARLRQRLLEKRSARAQPLRDEKVLVGWNAQAIGALVELGLATGEERFLERAQAAGRLLRERAAGAGTGLAHVLYRTGPLLPATLEDRAATALAALWLHEATGRESWFAWALELAAEADRRHRDGAGLWFDVPGDGDPRLPARPTTLEEGASRSGASLMIQLCWRLHALTGDRRWEELAETALARLRPHLESAPASFGGVLAEAQVLAAGPVELALVAPAGGHRTLLGAARSRLRPHLAVAVGDGREGADSPPLVRGRPPVGGQPTAYVCRGFACRLPTSKAEDMEREMDG